MSFHGWLQKRTTPQGGSMTRRYSVLAGTLLLDYAEEAHYRNGRPPAVEAEVIGVSHWHGKGRSHTYEHGLVYVTRLGGTYYCACESTQARDAWMAYMHRGLELSLDAEPDEEGAPTSPPASAPDSGGGRGAASPPPLPLSPSRLEPSPQRPSPPRPKRHSLHRGVLEPPQPMESDVCVKSGQPFGLTASRYHCTSCGAVCASDWCCKETPLPHHGLEAAARVCDDCFSAQQLLLHLRLVSGIFEAHLHEHRRARRGERAAVAKIMRVPNAATKFHSSSLQTGLGLLEKGKISRDEFSGIVKAEQRYQRDEAANRVHSMRASVVAADAAANGQPVPDLSDAAGPGAAMNLSASEDVLRLIKLLHDSAQSDLFNVHEFHFIIQALHDLAQRDLDLIDFFWPQVVHTHYLLVPAPTFEGVLKAELLEDFMLALCLKSAHLAVKLIWWLRGYLDDLARRGSPLDADGDGCGKQVYLMRLALEVEDTMLTAGAAAAAAASSPPAKAPGSGGAGAGIGRIAEKKGGEEEEDDEAEDVARLERRVLRSLLRPTGAQSSLIADQVLMLQQLRRAVSEEFCVTYRAKLKMLGSDSAAPHSLPPTPPLSPPRPLPAIAAANGGGYSGVQAARYFEEQLAFVEELTDIAERLRFVQPVTSRADHLRIELAALEGEAPPTDPAALAAAAAMAAPAAAAAAVKAAGMGGRSVSNSSAAPGAGGKRRRMPGYLPVFRASDPICPILRIPVAEGHVFKTKERAPTLIVCEVVSPEPAADLAVSGGEYDASVGSDDEGLGLCRTPSRTGSEAGGGGANGSSREGGSWAPRTPSDASRHHSWRLSEPPRASDIEQLIDVQVGERAGALQRGLSASNPGGGGGGGSSSGGSASADSCAAALPQWPQLGPGATIYPEVVEALELHKLLLSPRANGAAARLSAPRGALAAVVGDANAAAARNAAAAVAAGTPAARIPASPRAAAAAAAAPSLRAKGGALPASQSPSPGRRQDSTPPGTGNSVATANPGKGKGIGRKSLESLSSLSPLRLRRDRAAAGRATGSGIGNGLSAGAASGASSGASAGDPNLGSSSKHTSFENVFDILRTHSGHGMAKRLDNSGQGLSIGGSAYGGDAAAAGGSSGDGTGAGGSSGADVSEESEAVAVARGLFAGGVITGEELAAVIRKDREFNEAVEEHAILDVQFCVSQAFGESWESKRARIKDSSPVGATPDWDLVSIIVKSNDDLRQEVCALQLIELCRRVFADERRELWLQPYLIISTGNNMGLLQTLTNTASIDSLKKKPGFVNLARHFETAYGGDGARSVRRAQHAFVHSLAAYSLVCYVFQIKDRHNGNMLLDTEGHIVHIDFGFMLGIAPGGAFSLESSPFKLTVEMVEVMGGLDSELFRNFVIEFTCGFLALQKQRQRIVTLVEMLTRKSPFPCFQDKDTAAILQRLHQRLAPGLDMAATVDHCLDLIQESYNNYQTRQYDNFQWYTNGIVP